MYKRNCGQNDGANVETMQHTSAVTPMIIGVVDLSGCIATA